MATATATVAVAPSAQEAPLFKSGVEQIAVAAERGAELVVFPETVVPYYPYFSFIRAPAAIGAAPSDRRKRSSLFTAPPSAQSGCS